MARSLLRAASASGAPLSAYADDALRPGDVLRTLGWQRAGQFTDWRGALPILDVPVPDELRVLPLTGVPSLNLRRQAQAAYADRLGHTLVSEADIVADAHGSDDRISHVALNASGQGVGICRVWLEGDTLTVGSPGVHPALRRTGLRHALLRATCSAARARGARHLIMQAWGDTPAETQADAELGLTAATVTPIHLSR